MKVKELSQKLNLRTLVEGDSERAVEGCYCGDLLSWVMSRIKENDVWLTVMGKAPAGCAWVTVMGNMNSVAVASLAEIGAIVLADGVKPDENAVKRAEENGINIYLSQKPVFDTALEIYKEIN